MGPATGPMVPRRVEASAERLERLVIAGPTGLIPLIYVTNAVFLLIPKATPGRECHPPIPTCIRTV
jgi:hypothetical protein